MCTFRQLPEAFHIHNVEGAWNKNAFLALCLAGYLVCRMNLQFRQIYRTLFDDNLSQFTFRRLVVSCTFGECLDIIGSRIFWWINHFLTVRITIVFISNGHFFRDVSVKGNRLCIIKDNRPAGVLCFIVRTQGHCHFCPANGYFSQFAESAPVVPFVDGCTGVVVARLYRQALLDAVTSQDFQAVFYVYFFRNRNRSSVYLKNNFRFYRLTIINLFCITDSQFCMFRYNQKICRF